MGRLARRTMVVCTAVTRETVGLIDACSVVVTRLSSAVIDVGAAVVARETGAACTLEAVDPVNALSVVEARPIRTLINVHAARHAACWLGPTGVALALVRGDAGFCAHQVRARAVVAGIVGV